MLLAVMGMMAVTSTGALAAVPGAGWEIASHTAPTNLTPGKIATIIVQPLNIGLAPSEGAVTVTDELPPGVTAIDAGDIPEFSFSRPEEPELGHEYWDCTGNGSGPAPALEGATVVTCHNDPVNLPVLAGGGGTPNRSKFRPQS